MYSEFLAAQCTILEKSAVLAFRPQVPIKRVSHVSRLRPGKNSTDH
jgi:hypothetical protein